jgi:hypothetical protein
MGEKWTFMVRTAGTLAILLGFIGWLVLSYWPAGAAMLPTIAFDGAWATVALPLAAAATLLVSGAIQAWLVYATGRSLRTPAGPVQAAALSEFGLSVGREMVWTAAPLLFTIALGAWIVLGSH